MAVVRVLTWILFPRHPLMAVVRHQVLHMPQPAPSENSSYMAVLLSAGLLIPFAAGDAVAGRSGESWSHHRFIWGTLFWMFFCGMLVVVVGGYLDSLPRSRHKSDIVFWLWAATILTFLILSAQPQYARE